MFMTNRLNVKAILIGMAAMVAVSVLIGLAMSVATIISPQFLDRLTRMENNNLNHFLLLGALIPCIVGGFIAGCVAKHDRVNNAFALAIASLIFRESAALFLGHGSVLYRLLGETLGVLATVSGGYLARLAFEKGSKQTDRHI